MKIVQVNNCDLMGRRFNGHDLQISLNTLGHQAFQFVAEKMGKEDTTISLCSTDELLVRKRLRNFEYRLSMNSLIFPYGKALSEHPIYLDADIAHYHLIHNHLISILDFPRLTNIKPSVWTVHDPWLVTGHCVHPEECSGWTSGCKNCPKLNDQAFPMQLDKAGQMWSIKKKTYKQMDIDIVVASDFMHNYVKNSPLTAHFANVHKIPFGIEVEKFQDSNQFEVRKKWGITGDFVIAFRAEWNEFKGLKYIIEMLDQLNTGVSVTILTVGSAVLPEYLSEKYQLIQLGWRDDLNTLYDFYAAADVFIMPSTVESFGVMAIESMASGCPIIVFEDTVLSEITFAPECGIAVRYKDSTHLKFAVESLMKDPNECLYRGKKGIEIAHKHYSYNDYVQRHIALYNSILEKKEKKEN